MWRKCWALMKSAYNATTVEPAYFIFSFSLVFVILTLIWFFK